MALLARSVGAAIIFGLVLFVPWRKKRPIFPLRYLVFLVLGFALTLLSSLVSWYPWPGHSTAAADAALILCGGLAGMLVAARGDTALQLRSDRAEDGWFYAAFSELLGVAAVRVMTEDMVYVGLLLVAGAVAIFVASICIGPLLFDKLGGRATSTRT